MSILTANPNMKKLIEQAKVCRTKKKVSACSVCPETNKCNIMKSQIKEWSKK